MNRDNSLAVLVLIAVIIFVPLVSGSAYVITIGVFSGINALIAIGLCILMGMQVRSLSGKPGSTASGRMSPQP